MKVFLPIKLLQQQQKISNLFVDVTCRSVIDYFILLYYMVPLAVRMRQHEPQAMTFIEMLPVHVDLQINKHRKSKSERKQKRKVAKQGTPEKVSWAIQSTTNSNHLCLSRGHKPMKQV